MKKALVAAGQRLNHVFFLPPLEEEEAIQFEEIFSKMCKMKTILYSK